MTKPILGVLMTLPDMTRDALTDAELDVLPPEGIRLVVGDVSTGERCPPGGVIRQSSTGWWWHPDMAHARAAAMAAGDHAFIHGGDGALLGPEEFRP